MGKERFAKECMGDRDYFDSIARLREGKPWMTNAALCLLGVGLLGLTRQFVVENKHFVIGFSGASGWSVWLYVAAVVIVLTQPMNRGTFWIVVGFAVAFRGLTIAADPFLSSDIYRYVWDGVVQHAHVNPYRYVPGDAALTALRVPHQELFDNINRRDYARTIYPPVAQMIYWVVTLFSQTVRGMKIAMFGFECVTVWGLVALLKHMGRCSPDVLLYAWCPLLVWEIGDAGHIDAAVIAFVVLAMLFRYREKPVMVGLFLACAVLTKFYPLVLFPALWMRRDWKMPAVMVGMAAATYAMYASVGKLVFGFLGEYTQEEGMNTGTRYFFLDFARKFVPGISVGMFSVFCVVVMGALCWLAWVRATVEVPALCDPTLSPTARKDGPPAFVPQFMKVAMCLAFVMMLLFSPHYPWYVAWLVPFLVLVPNLPLMAYLMAFFYLFTTALADGMPEKMLMVNEYLYGAVLVACVVQWVWLRWRVGRWFVSAERMPYARIGNS